MSSLATALRRAAPGAPRATHSARALGSRLGPDTVVGLALVACLTLIAFVTAGGVDLARNTWVEIALLVLAAGLAVTLIAYSPSGRPWGAMSAVLFAGVAALTALSISWSVQPDTSWLEANRTLSYAAVFAGAIAFARLLGARWRSVVGALAALATILSAYALLVKVFPGTFDAADPVGRVRAPFDYWNATGLMAALGLAPALWTGARRDGGRVLRALSVPAVAILVTVMILSYSRSALLAAIVGSGCWFVLVPLRLRAALMLLLGLAGAAALAGWALATHALTHDRVSLAARTAAGHGFGLVLVLVLALLTVAGFVAAFATDRVPLAPELRRRVGIALISLAALAPLGGIGALAASSRGLTGEISHVWNTLTNPNSGVGDSPNRLVQLGNSRPRYWSEGLKVGEHSLLHGVGAAGYGTARTRYTSDPWIVEHAHSYPIETFADFGLIGLGLNLALLVAWWLAAARTFGLRRLREQPESASRQEAIVQERAVAQERAGLLTLLCVVVVFGVHSTIDWTWFVPGTAIPALFCAGWVAGRGPLARRPGRLRERPRLLERPALAASVMGIAAVSLLAAWAVWQPLRSANADSAAISALTRGDVKGAFGDARAAAASDPVSVEPLWELSAIYSATGDQHAAHAQLVKAISLQPDNSATWRELGFYDLQHNQPHKAMGVLQKALALDRSSPQTIQAIQQAQTQLAASGRRKP
ncbi:MAG: O-antigen ligase family protein [Solirubrobacteraceae bacterium]